MANYGIIGNRISGNFTKCLEDYIIKQWREPTGAGILLWKTTMDWFTGSTSLSNDESISGAINAKTSNIIKYSLNRPPFEPFHVTVAEGMKCIKLYTINVTFQFNSYRWSLDRRITPFTPLPIMSCTSIHQQFDQAFTVYFTLQAILGGFGLMLWPLEMWMESPATWRWKALDFLEWESPLNGDMSGTYPICG
jgi:hypothetical protein